MNVSGVIIAAACFLVIGIFHPIVIKAEYHFSAGCWPAFLAAGIAALAASTQVEHVTVSAVLGVLGCSCLWSILELKEQEKRVERGWFPANPKRKTAGSKLYRSERKYGTNDKKGAGSGDH